MSAAEDSRAVALAARLQRAAASLTTALIAFLAAWLFREEFSLLRAGLALLLTLPLWVALPRLLTGNRRTYAWMTLAVIPYLAIAIVEAIANPLARAWAGVCLIVAFSLFLVLIGYLRVSKGSGDFTSVP